jgi:hypothetical protein
MLNARRDDTGVYTLKIENEHGSDSADVSVIVTVAPSKPHGPMKISDVYAEGLLSVKNSLKLACVHLIVFITFVYHAHTKGK